MSRTSLSTAMGYRQSPECQGHAFLLPVLCGHNSVSRARLSTAGVLYGVSCYCWRSVGQSASLEQLLSHMAMVCLSQNCPRNGCYCDLGFVLDFVLESVLELASELVLDMLWRLF